MVPALSICLIARDEAAVLPACLTSVTGLLPEGAQEIVLLDTGSSDETIAIAQAHGARVHSFPWCDDFSAARNAALAHCHGEWVLQIDADESLDERARSGLRALLGSPESERHGAGTLALENQRPDGSRSLRRLLRLWRNRPDIQYLYPVHEDASQSVLAMLEREGLALAQLPGRLRHVGYEREHLTRGDKRDRDLRLLTRALEQDPDDLYIWQKLLEHADYWRDPGLREPAARGALAALSRCEPAQAPRRCGGVALIGRLAEQLDADQLRALDAQVPDASRTVDYELRLGRAAELRGSPSQAVSHFEKALHLAELGEEPSACCAPLYELARLDLARGDGSAALRRMCEALDTTPRYRPALLSAVGLLCRLGRPEQAQQMCTAVSEREGGARWLGLAEARACAGDFAGAREDFEALGQQDVAHAALGLLLLNQIDGVPSELDVDLEAREAEDWLLALLGHLEVAGQLPALVRFDANAGALPEIFPRLRARAPQFSAPDARA